MVGQYFGQCGEFFFRKTCLERCFLHVGDGGLDVIMLVHVDGVEKRRFKQGVFLSTPCLEVDPRTCGVRIGRNFHLVVIEYVEARQHEPNEASNSGRSDIFRISVSYIECQYVVFK